MWKLFCNLFGKKKEKKVEKEVEDEVTRADAYILVPKTRFWDYIPAQHCLETHARLEGVPWMDNRYMPLTVPISIAGERNQRRAFSFDIERASERARAVLLYTRYGGEWDPFYLFNFAKQYWYDEKVIFWLEGKWLDADSMELFQAIRLAAQAREPIRLFCKWKNR